MKWVLDNTVMSNFSLIERVGWLASLGDGNFVTVQEAWNELQQGLQKGILPVQDWEWLEIETLSELERADMADLIPPLDVGEAACLSLAWHRGYGVLTDDRLALCHARVLGVPLSGTLGILKLLVEGEYLSLSKADEALAMLTAMGYRSPIVSLKEMV